MRRVIGIDLHRTFGEVVFWEDGRLRHAGRVDMTRTALEGFGKSLSATDEIVIEATGNAMAVSRVLSPFVKRVIIANPLQVKAIAHAHVKTDMCGLIWTPPDCNSLTGSSFWSQLLTYIRLSRAARSFVAASPDGFPRASTSVPLRHWLQPCRSTHQVREATAVTVSPSPAILLQLLGEISFLSVRPRYLLKQLTLTVWVRRLCRRRA